MPKPLRSPPEIARETLRRLALEKRPPTPDNFRALYAEIAGTPIEDVFPERALRVIASALPRATPESLRLAQPFDNAIASRHWNNVRQAILSMCARGETIPTNWSNLIRESSASSNVLTRAGALGASASRWSGSFLPPRMVSTCRHACKV